MGPISLEEDLKYRRTKLLIQCQEYMASFNEKSPQIQSEGNMAGRSVKQKKIDPTDSITSRLYKNYAISTEKDRLSEGRVNSVKSINSNT